jgi:hypothetical protein
MEPTLLGSPAGPNEITPKIAAAVVPQEMSAYCPSCAAAASRSAQQSVQSQYVYAIGTIEPRFPRVSVEKELAQVIGRAETANLTDRQALRLVLEARQNRYLVRQICWIMTIEGLETYIVVPRDPMDYDALIESLRASPTPMDLDVLIGVRGPIAGPDACNGLMLPIVFFDTLYSFDRDSFINAIPRPANTADGEFAPAATDLFDRIILTDNAGASDQDRALNYLAVRYPAIYEAAAFALADNSSLSAVRVHTSTLSGVRRIVEVIFSFTNRRTDVTEKQFVRVDVTDEFPFLMTKMSPYYDR